MVALYADENFSWQVVQELFRLGHDVLTVLQAGQANQGIQDAAVLAFAVQQGRAVLTYNRRHFIRLHQTFQNHCGIIVCSDDPDRLAQALRIPSREICTACQAEFSSKE